MDDDVVGGRQKQQEINDTGDGDGNGGGDCVMVSKINDHFAKTR